MPLNSKGKKILQAFQNEYGEERGKQYFYASERLGKFINIKAHSKKRKSKKKKRK